VNEQRVVAPVRARQPAPAMAPSPRDQKASRPLPLLARSRGRAAAALVAPASSGDPTLAASRDCDEGARARIHRGLRAAMHVLRDRVRRVGVAPAMLAARRLQFRSHRSVGNHGAGGVTGHHAGVLGFRVDCRGRRVVSGVRRESAVVAVPAPRRLAERLRPVGEQARRLVRQRRSGSALGCSSSSVRCSSSASSCSPFTRWAGKAAWDLRGGCGCKAGQRGGTRNARGSSGGRPSGRERRSGERTAGRSG